ncbi:GNAT family N-acetyltransferase [Flavobacterium sp. XS2P12]|uniref:GNAT family N-acetyltransferase n=1 Tax=Flavobacterium melibiosi TaxID=3398734 RepID=UPI003A83F272
MVELRQMNPQDWENVARIYFEGIQTGNATFQLDKPTYEEWNVGHLKNCRIVAISNNQIVGWAALTPVSDRCVYAGVAEVSIYVSDKHRGQKIGAILLAKLILKSEEENIWTLQAGIFPENIPSIKLHEQLGFRKVGYRDKIGKMNGIWRDSLLFERRSESVGID